MKMLLISPRAKMDQAMKIEGGFKIAQMSTAQIAALLPEHVEVQLVDELVEHVNFDSDADLIGITAMTETVERAYVVADGFRERGKPVVLGGVHATLCPEEAKQHADCVVIGEAEGLMPRLIDDFLDNGMKPFYKREELLDIKQLPIPRRDLLDKSKYVTVNCINTARGCPNRCSFCAVPTYYGNKFRQRSLDDVLAEIRGLDGPYIFFSDDNLSANIDYTKELLRRLAPFKMKIAGQLSFKALQDEELLKLLKQAGGVGFLVGFESLSQGGLDEIKKNYKTGDYLEGVKRYMHYGMILAGSFIFGLDADGPDVFEKTVDFVDRSGMDVCQFTLLSPYPATRLYSDLLQQDRLLDPQWWLHSGWNDVPFKPAKMTRDELHDGWAWATKEVYRFPRIMKRVGQQLLRRNVFTSVVSYGYNMDYRKCFFSE